MAKDFRQIKEVRSMLNYTEISPLPAVCSECKEIDCYNCEYAGERFILPEQDKIKISMEIKKKQLLRNKDNKRMRPYIIKWLKEYEELKNRFESI